MRKKVQRGLIKHDRLFTFVYISAVLFFEQRKWMLTIFNTCTVPFTALSFTNHWYIFYFTVCHKCFMQSWWQLYQPLSSHIKQSTLLPWKGPLIHSIIEYPYWCIKYQLGRWLEMLHCPHKGSFGQSSNYFTILKVSGKKVLGSKLKAASLNSIMSQLFWFMCLI